MNLQIFTEFLLLVLDFEANRQMEKIDFIQLIKFTDFHKQTTTESRTQRSSKSSLCYTDSLLHPNVLHKTF